MSVLSSLSSEKFNTLREEWENNLKAELKVPDASGKTTKKSIDGGTWPTLSLERTRAIQLPIKETWKKASQTYNALGQNSEKELHEDLSHGVRNFFFQSENLNLESWNRLTAILGSHPKSREMEVFLLGTPHFKIEKTSFRLILESEMMTGRFSHDGGGTITGELALLATELIEALKDPHPVIYLGVFSDSQFFRNIAKQRAAKLLAFKILEESNLKKDIVLVSLTSYREWTMYERYSNMLRNDSAVASAYIGGADHVQSAGYNSLFEFTGTVNSEHRERSLRMARNTAHILALESMLGVVHDPSFGSYHLENLTLKYAEEAWKEMQGLLKLSAPERKKFIQDENRKVREDRFKNIRSRKHVLAGINDFPDAKEELKLSGLPKFSFFRVAEGFEALRLQMENLEVRPEVSIGIFGDYAALNARLNFVKNYFQLLGLTVHEVFNEAELEKKEGIVVLCASDEDYPSLVTMKTKAQDKFIAGKFELSGFINLFAGQDVFSVLEGIVSRWGAKWAR